MTTDAEEGRRQIEAMKPEPLKVGDKVRLAAGEREMVVIDSLDYGNIALCAWKVWPGEAGYDPEALDTVRSDRFPARSLVRVSSEVEGQ